MAETSVGAQPNPIIMISGPSEIKCNEMFFGIREKMYITIVKKQF